MLLVKLGLVALALTWGAVHHFVVEPRLDRPGVVARLPRSLAGEAAVGMAVLLFAAILVNTAPASASGRRHQLERGAGGVGSLCEATPRRVLGLLTTLPPSSTTRSRAASVSSTPK